MPLDKELIAQLLRDTAPKSMVFIDSTAGTSDPEGMAIARRTHVRDGLSAAGAPDADIEAILEAMADPTGVADPSVRFAIAQDGELRFHTVMGGSMQSDECIRYGSIVDVTPLRLQIPDDELFFTVSAWRGGGDINVFAEGDRDPIVTKHIESDSPYINKVSAGRTSEANLQRHSEETWKQTQSDVAEQITALIAEHHPRVIFLSGDVRAVQLLSGQLSDQATHLLHVIPGEVNTEGASEDRVRHALEVQLDAARRRRNRTILDEAAADNGRLQATGFGDVVHALAQGQADYVFIDHHALLQHSALALEGEPWVATAPEDALGSPVLEEIVATAAIVRAAVLTDAKVRIVDPDEIGEGTGVVASLRWPAGPERP
ncbi:Vms1/Ankzf1 family peptidyl-tRNA hydrolase [Paramicrobacterium fandaimingii]|uniref:baeRF2 domain-containing protein n=1 Tax=Paramicrobacterium fandaimingii TaxID=2708079 RepID=UPI0014225DDC|nr:Vms1/Ankzf1 family peptidyl-tRNA hydrolase [Microbacterium fandaimingii]